MTNTDGDPLEFHKLVFEVDSAEAAFDKLAPLCTTETKEEIRRTATVDADMRISSIEFPWSGPGFKGHAGLSNTVLGRICIDNRKVTIDVNSAERAAAIRQKVEARLGGTARFRLDEIQDTDAMLAHSADRVEDVPALAGSDELMKNPEVMAQIAEMMDAHWTGWVDEKLPALNGRTPRQAVRTADGREAVEALLVDIEGRKDAHDPWDALNRKGVRLVREKLGLARKEQD